MTDGRDLEADIDGLDDVSERRNRVVENVRAHAGQIARELAVLEGGDYGQETFDTDGGTWTLKYEAGDIEYLRYKPKSGSETYVISTKQPPEPEALEAAMADYDSFVAAYNDHVASFDGVLADVPSEFPPVVTAEELVAERDRIVAKIRAVADAMAVECYRFDGEYGTYSATVSGTRWELKWDGERAAYLRVGGEGGTYLVSQYGPPAAPDVRRYAEGVVGFVEAFNEYVTDLEADLATVSFADV
ncbi:hypothetical protein [Natronobiforma cellulositropha]|uniref:hypothetical protein n=1 Tax=Natronobiforma cellulositropha TaxID=1679076 RepID=UPI0021D596C0|nr:hypothetical protein [Natronobiforma cellulositropha]